WKFLHVVEIDALLLEIVDRDVFAASHNRQTQIVFLVGENLLKEACKSVRPYGPRMPVDLLAALALFARILARLFEVESGHVLRAFHKMLEVIVGSRSAQTQALAGGVQAIGGVVIDIRVKVF